MIARLCLGMVFSLLAVSPLGAQSTVRADGDSAAMAEVAALEYHLIDLLQRHEIEAYATHLASDYVRVNRYGEVATAAEALAGFRSSEPDDPGAGRPALQTPSDLTVRIYGDTAILTFVLTRERQGEAPIRSRLVKVFVRRDGRWIMVHNQGTALE